MLLPKLLTLLTPLLLLLSLPPSKPFPFRGLQLNLTDYRVRAVSTYTIYFDRTVDSYANITVWDRVLISVYDNITVIFPVEFGSTTGYTCVSLYVDDVGVRGYTCGRTGNRIVLRNFLTADTYIKKVVLTVSNVTNPSIGGQTTNFLGSIGNDTATPTDFSSIRLLPNSFTQCLGTFNSAISNTTGQLQLSITAVHILPTNSYLVVTFPFYWTRDYARQLLRFNVDTFCGVGRVCTGGVDRFGQPVVRVDGVGGDYGVYFGVNGVLAPPTNQPVDVIKIASFATADQPIDQCSFYPTGIRQRQITSITAIPLQPPYPSTNITLSLTFTLSQTLTPSDTLYLDFSSTYTPSFTYTSISSQYPITLLSTSGTLLNFTINRLLNMGQSLSFTVETVRTAPSLAGVGGFQVGVEMYGWTKMRGGFGVRVEVGVVGGITVAVEGKRAGGLGVYRLGFAVEGGIGQSGAVRVYFPDTIGIPANVKVYCQGIQLQVQQLPNTTCLQLTGFLIPPTNPITLTFTPLTNPPTTSPLTLPLQIKTYLTSTLMDQVSTGSQSFLLTFEPAPTLQVTAASSSSVTGQPDINVTLQVRNGLPVGYGARVEIWFFGIEVGVVRVGCYVGGVVQACWVGNGSVVVVEINSTAVAAAAGFTITVSDFFINTPVTKAISYFLLKTYTPEGYLLQSQQIPAFITNVNQPRPLDYFILYSRTSLTNSALASYTFVLSQSQPLIPGTNTVTLTFPPALSLASASCPSCSITLPSTLTAPMSSQFQLLTIDNILNAPSTQPVRGIYAAVMLDAVYGYSVGMLAGDVVNTGMSAVQVGVGFGVGVYGGVGGMVVDVGGVYGGTGGIVFGFPREFGVAGAACAITGATLTSLTVSNSSLILNVTNITSTNLTISFTNITYPSIPQTLPILLTTYTPTSYLISQSQLPPWSPTCQLPCLSCQASTPTHCLSCFTDPTITPLILYNPLTFSCVDQCTEIQLQIQLVCVRCLLPCLGCAGRLDLCTSCGVGLYLYAGICVGVCPGGYYRVVVGRYCERCRVPCLECVSDVQCTSCLTNWFYYRGNCLITCPSQLTVPDPINNRCLPCSIECLTCSILPTNCTSCSQAFAMQNQTCVSECSNNFYINNTACVPGCQVPCLTCAIYAGYCTSCPVGYYLYTGVGLSGGDWQYCVVGCPVMYYVGVGGVCQACGLLAIHCRYCINASACQICDPGYILFQSQCLNSTPPGYANISGIASPCTQDCLTCSSLPNNCTSCRTLNYHNGLCITNCPDSHYAVNHTCVRCVPPCNNCLNETACLSCLGGLNRFFVGATLSCQLACPSFYYGNASVYQCLPCVAPCVTCTQPTVCLSCISSTYLYNSRCLTVCPSGYFPNTTINICTACLPPCQTCSPLSPSTCLTCLSPNLYLHPNQCVPTCPPTYIPNYQYMLCQNCTAPCLLCSQTACFKCQPLRVLYQGACVVSCPTTHYAMVLGDGTRECVLCPGQCQMCSNGSFCLLCAIGYWWEMGAGAGSCVRTCPADRPILEKTGCEPCQDPNCTACYPNNECYQCQNTSILFEGFCLDSCPAGYIYNISIQTCQLAPPPEPQNTTIPSTPEPEPNLSVTIVMPFYFIFTLVGAGLSVIAIIIGCWAGVGVWGLLAGGWAGPEVGALGVSAYAYHRYFVSIFVKGKVYGFVMVAAMAWLFLINFATFFYSICRVMLPDSKYRRWKRTAPCRHIFFLSLCQTATLISHKFQHLLWSGLKPTPKLQDPHKLRYLSLASSLTLLTEIAYTVILIFLLSDAKELFYLWLDTIIVLSLSAISSGLALRRSEKFFEEKGEEFVLHRRYVESDQFLSRPMKGAVREERGGIGAEEKGLAQSFYGDTSSEISSRLELRSSTSSRGFLPSSHRQSLHEPTPEPSLESPCEPDLHTSRSKKQFSLQVSILARSNPSHPSLSPNPNPNGSYFIECDYSEGTKNAIMGSIEQSKGWDGVVHEPVYYKEEYDLDQAVILDPEGKVVENWDVESNQAVVEEELGYTRKEESQGVGGQAENILAQLDDIQLINISNTKQPQHNNNNNQHNTSITPILHTKHPANKTQLQHTTPLQSSTIQPKHKHKHEHEHMPIQQPQQQTYIHRYRDILQERLQGERGEDGQEQGEEEVAQVQRRSFDEGVLGGSEVVSISGGQLVSNNTSHISQPERQIPNQPQQIEVQPQGDRFDNSVLSNHGGSGSFSSSSEYQDSGASNHNGSFEQEEPEEEPEKQPDNVEAKMEVEKEIEKEVEHVDDMDGQLERKYTTVSVEIGDEGEIIKDEQQRWQFLLHEQAEQQTTDAQQSPTQPPPTSIHQTEDQQQSQHQNQHSLQPIEEQQSRELTAVGEQGQLRASVKKSRIASKEIGRQKEKKEKKEEVEVDGEKEQQRDEEEDGEEEWDENDGQPGSGEEQYLGPKLKRKDSKPDDHNKFSIKTKRKKQNEPKHKVVVVDSRKFSKLKRQASELQREIEQGERLKTLMDQQEKEKEREKRPKGSKSKNKKKDREEELKAVYLRSGHPEKRLQ